MTVIYTFWFFLFSTRNEKGLNCSLNVVSLTSPERRKGGGTRLRSPLVCKGYNQRPETHVPIGPQETIHLRYTYRPGCLNNV